MSQPKSLEQLHQECCEELRRLDPGAGQRGGAVSRAGGPAWISIAGMAWSLITTFYLYLVVWQPLRAKLKELRDALDNQLRELRKNQATELSIEALQTIAEIKRLLEQHLPELRGKFTRDGLNGARDGVSVHLEEQGTPPAQAEEMAQTVTDVAGKPFLGPSDEGKPPAS